MGLASMYIHTRTKWWYYVWYAGKPGTVWTLIKHNVFHHRRRKSETIDEVSDEVMWLVSATLIDVFLMFLMAETGLLFSFNNYHYSLVKLTLTQL